MYQVGHYGASLFVYAPLGAGVAATGHETVAVVGGLVCVSLSTLPDCDHQLPFVEHRGPTHTVLFALLVGAALAAAAAVLVDAASPLADVGFVGFAFVVGTLSIGSHLLADALTPMGIRPFWPVSRRRYTWNVTPAKDPVANYALFAVGIGAVLGAVGLVFVLG
jgi:inner membrane protein